MAGPCFLQAVLEAREAGLLSFCSLCCELRVGSQKILSYVYNKGTYSEGGVGDEGM